MAYKVLLQGTPGVIHPPLSQSFLQLTTSMSLRIYGNYSGHCTVSVQRYRSPYVMCIPISLLHHVQSITRSLLRE